MLKTIIKRDGRREEFTPDKLNKWAIWASQDLKDRIDWSDIVLETVKVAGEEIDSQSLQKLLIKSCIQKRNWAYNVMAGRLYAAIYHKELYGNSRPHIRTLHDKLFDLGLMKLLDYTDEQYDQINAIIDHERDFKMAHFQLEYARHKYSLQDRVKGEAFETPQFIYMRLAMALAEDEPEDIKVQEAINWYEEFSNARVSCPTPNYINLGTIHNGFASCCLIKVNDTARSLAIGDHIAYTMTYMSAGIGTNIQTRSVGDAVRSGSIKHKGKLPYYEAVGKAVRANTQGGRGGACTAYFSCFDPEADVIIMLQNPLSVDAVKNRDIHFAMMYNDFFAEKVAKNEDIFTFNVHTAPDLEALFYSSDTEAFAAKYQEYENNPKFVKNYVSARDRLINYGLQTHEVATMYSADMTELNRHTPHLNPIYSSNLCVAPETLILTNKGYQEIQTLVNQSVAVWNGEEWSDTTVVKTGENQELVMVNTVEGHSLCCTPYHKFYIYHDSTDKVVEVRAQDLKNGDRLITWFNPVTQTQAPADYVYSVVKLKDCKDTYCFTEPKRHMGVFNGILTGQCLEVTQPTKGYVDMRHLFIEEDHPEAGEVSMCSLAAIIPSNIKNDEQYAKAAYYALKMIDKCIHKSTHEFPQVRYTSRQRLNAGVGLIGIAHIFAKKGLTFDSPQGLAEAHRIAERHSYFMIKASLQLAKELGPAPWMHKTKWPKGWLPIDTYKKNVDKLVPPNYKYDWESLRHEIIKTGGIRNSSLVSHMPTESSSKPTGFPNGLYPVREEFLKKTDADSAVTWVARDNDLYEGQYQSAWDIDTNALIKYYAVFQKFADQAISADLYKDRVKFPDITTEELIKNFLTKKAYGVKTQYYQNSYTVESVDLENTGSSPKLMCGSGGCDV